MLNKDYSPPHEVIDHPQSSALQHNNQGDNNNNCFVDAPLSPSTFSVPPIDQGDDLPPFFSPLPSIAETFGYNTCSNTSLEDELNPPYQYLGWHGMDDLFTPWFQPSSLASTESFEDSGDIVLPTLPPAPPFPPRVVSGGRSEPSELHSVPIIVDQLDNNEATEAPPSPRPIGTESISTTPILPSSQSLPTMEEPSFVAMVVVPSVAAPTITESNTEAMVESSVEAMVIVSSCPCPSIVEPSSSNMVASLSSSSSSSSTMVEPDAEAMIVTHSSPLPAMAEPDSKTMVVAPTSPPPSMVEFSAEAMVATLTSPSPASAEPNSDGAMVIAPSSSPSMADSSSEAMVVAPCLTPPSMVDSSSVEAMVVPSSSAPPVTGEAANNSKVMSVKSSKSHKRKNQNADSSGEEDGGYHGSSDVVGSRQGVPTVSEMDLLERFLHLGTTRDILRPLIIRVNGEQDIVDVITSLAKEKRCNLLILGTVGTLSVVELLQEEKPATFEGNFIIISFSGSIILPKDSDMQSTSQLSVSVVGADGKVFGGPVHGRLIAASPMQTVGLALIQKIGRKARGLKAKLNIPKLQKMIRSIKGRAKAQAKGKNPESEEEANCRREHEVLKELNENITKCDETKIDEKLAEYMDAELQLAPAATGSRCIWGCANG